MTLCTIICLFFQDGYTALMLASRDGHSEVAKLLLADPRVDVNLQDKVRE